MKSWLKLKLGWQEYGNIGEKLSLIDLKVSERLSIYGFLHFYWFYEDLKLDFNTLAYPIFTPRHFYPSELGR